MSSAICGASLVLHQALSQSGRSDAIPMSGGIDDL